MARLIVKKLLSLLKLYASFCKEYLLFLWRCPSLKEIIKRTLRGIQAAAQAIPREISRQIRGTLAGNTSSIHDLSWKQLHSRSKGLHKELYEKSPLGFSIVIPVYHPDPRFFEELLESCLLQTAPKMEILIGLDGSQPSAIQEIIQKLINRHDASADKIKIYPCAREKTSGGISNTTNELIAAAKYEYLLFVDHDDWIRPDLLYRYHLTLASLVDGQTTALYCDEFKMDTRGNIIPGTTLRKPWQPEFPYVFVNYICHCLLVPKSVFTENFGLLDPLCDGAQDFDLVLRLYSAKIKLINVPIPLYGWRVHALSTASNANQKPKATQAGILALQKLTVREALPWIIEDGILPTTYRAKASPDLTNVFVHVIIPFKDNKNLTLRCLQSLLSQKKIAMHITFIDHNSSDLSIRDELLAAGVEVLSYSGCFNFSRINNFGLQNSKLTGQLTLFLNNDVELESTAIYEMAAWATDPNIGVVGARLHFPDQTIQHGGIKIARNSPKFDATWEHENIRVPSNKPNLSLVTRTVDAVTGAALMIRTELFRELGGFDEIHFPIAYSDTDLCVRVRMKGLKILYTPYAIGVHHEGKTRGRYAPEDFESSSWLMHKLGRATALSDFQSLEQY